MNTKLTMKKIQKMKPPHHQNIKTERFFHFLILFEKPNTKTLNSNPDFHPQNTTKHKTQTQIFIPKTQPNTKLKTQIALCFLRNQTHTSYPNLRVDNQSTSNLKFKTIKPKGNQPHI